LGAQYGKLDADLRASALLGTLAVHSVHVYYPFALEDGGRLAHKAVELVDRVATLVVVCRSCSMGVIDSRYYVLAFTSACNISFVDLLSPSLWTAFRGFAARLLATSFYYSLCYFGFLSS
jgi:hypothetical protein